jgi:hypothetical protein
VTRLVVSGIVVVLGVQLIAWSGLDRTLVVAAAGVALGVVLLAVRWQLVRHRESTGAEVDDTGAAMRRWLVRTETTLAWAESSRADWDRRLRPMLARQFELAAGQRRAKDPNAFRATGHMLFGEQLWPWVDPENISPTGATEPGPGRDTLDEILRRLERL